VHRVQTRQGRMHRPVNRDKVLQVLFREAPRESNCQTEAVPCKKPRKSEGEESLVLQDTEGEGRGNGEKERCMQGEGADARILSSVLIKEFFREPPPSPPHTFKKGIL